MGNLKPDYYVVKTVTPNGSVKTFADDADGSMRMEPEPGVLPPYRAEGEIEPR